MMDWTDRHCRVFHRQITKHTWLYTEMVTTGALVYGDVERHLRYDDVEHPIALQLGGCSKFVATDFCECRAVARQRPCAAFQSANSDGRKP